MLLKARILLKLDRKSEATTALGQLWYKCQSIYSGWDVLIPLDPDGASRIADEFLTKDQ
ncbi:MAG: hypothetical protein Q4B08_15610 [Propionibacteriaceae bacterium]|nr:hypothetical protein [Propionibacteriaceae bacterium]